MKKRQSRTEDHDFLDENLNQEQEVKRPFENSNPMEFEDLLYGRGSRDVKLKKRPRNDAQASKPAVDPQLKAQKRAKRKRVMKRVAVTLTASVAALILVVYIFWRWLISGAETGMTAPSTTPSIDHGTAPVITDSTTVSETSGDSSFETEETTEGTIADRPTLPENTDYLEGIEYNVNLTNILIIGTDSRDSSGQTFERSDTMMLLTVNKDANEVKLTSFQRDMLVYLPGQSIPVKLNEANLRGPDFLVQTLNQNFLLNIEDYIMVNIMDAENLVDAIGGLEIYIEDDPDVLAYLNACIIEQNVMYEGWDDRSNWVDTIDKGGLLQLNGRQTIAYARMRKLDSDYQRMARQREVLTKAYEKSKASNLFSLIRLAKAGFDMIATNMTESELTAMIVSLLPAVSADVEQMQVPIQGYFWSDDNGPWVNRANFNLMIPFIHDFVYGEHPSSFIPVPLVPYTPMDYVEYKYMSMPYSVITGNFRDISYVGAYGWSGDGSAVKVVDGIAQLPNVTVAPRPSQSATPTPRPSSSTTETTEESVETSQTTTASSAEATPSPLPEPTKAVSPTAKPTVAPTATPTAKPTAKPTAAPTATPKPTAAPTATPKPTAAPTATPTAKPTAKPTATPMPTATPTAKPTAAPTVAASPTPVTTTTAEPPVQTTSNSEGTSSSSTVLNEAGDAP